MLTPKETGNSSTFRWPYEVGYSALFNGVNSYLRKPASATQVGSGRKWTLAFNAKFCKKSGDMNIIQGNIYADFNTTLIWRTGHLIISHRDAARQIVALTTTEAANDPTGHYAICVVADTDNPVQQDRFKVYINGVRCTLSGVFSPLGQVTYLNSLTQHFISGGSSNGIDGFVSDVYFLSNVALDPFSFGAFSIAVDGLWTTKPYTGVINADCYHLDFADASNLGKDVSGNGHDFVAYNNPVQTVDTPTNNYCTLNPLDPKITGTLSGGNLITTGNAAITLRPYTRKWSYKKNGSEILYDTGSSGQLNPVLTVGTYSFGSDGYIPTTDYKTVCAENLIGSDIVLSGTYTGNGLSDGPYVYTGCALATVIINSTLFTNDGTDNGAITFTASGFKLVSAAIKNTTGVIYYWSGVLKYHAATSNAQIN